MTRREPPRDESPLRRDARTRCPVPEARALARATALSHSPGNRHLGSRNRDASLKQSLSRRITSPFFNEDADFEKKGPARRAPARTFATPQTCANARRRRHLRRQSHRSESYHGAFPPSRARDSSSSSSQQSSTAPAQATFVWRRRSSRHSLVVLAVVMEKKLKSFSRVAASRGASRRARSLARARRAAAAAAETCVFARRRCVPVLDSHLGNVSGYRGFGHDRGFQLSLVVSIGFPAHARSCRHPSTSHSGKPKSAYPRKAPGAG